MESIRFKLWTTIIALIFIILTPIWYFQVVRLEQSYVNAKSNDVLNATNEAYAVLSEQDLDETISNQLSNIARDREVCISLFDNYGNQLVDYQMAISSCVFNQLDDANKSNVLSHINNIKSDKISFAVENNDSYPAAIYGSYIEGNNTDYLMVISTYAVPVSRLLDMLKSQLLVLTVPLLIAGTILAFIISASFTKPITRLTKATSEMAKGNYDVRVKVEAEDEIGILEENFNYMGEQISQLEELRRDLIANVSHDLKTPLTMIKGYAETIRDLTGANEEKRNQQLEIIIEESDRLNALVNDLLNLSRFQSGQIQLEYKIFDLNEMILNTLNQYNFLITNQGYTFQYEDAGPCYVSGDLLRMKQVIYNILNNAVNHTGDDKLIKIRLVKKDLYYRVEISDTGMGIKKEDLNRIWDRYYKIDKSGKRRVAGTGIGLAIVKQILSAHECLFGADSEYGHGATFYFEMNKVERFNKNDYEDVEVVEETVDHSEENV